MLSYLHGYHAGNLADLHKHMALAWTLDYLTRKDKPLSYLETHAGRGLYDLDGAEARKTGEAAQGIDRAGPRIDAAHPLARTIAAIRADHGPRAYPGSPMIASHLLRGDDVLHLAELHPAEVAALRDAVPGAHVHHADGLALALSIAPPMPRRGLCLIDPSWEVKEDYVTLPDTVRHLHRKWGVGTVMLWYPLLADDRHRPMLSRLGEDHPQALRHEVRFAPARRGHGMAGSGLFVVNPPWGLDAECARIAGLIDGLRTIPLSDAGAAPYT